MVKTYMRTGWVCGNGFRLMAIINFRDFNVSSGHARCGDCGWTVDIDFSEADPMQHLRNQVFEHIKKTRHTVDLTSSNVTQYYYTKPSF